MTCSLLNLLFHVPLSAILLIGCDLYFRQQSIEDYVITDSHWRRNRRAERFGWETSHGWFSTDYGHRI